MQDAEGRDGSAGFLGAAGAALPDAGVAERTDEELQAIIARWFGTLSSIVIPLTMLGSTRLRGMSNVTPTDKSAGPVHGWSIATLVRQATIPVSNRHTESMTTVAISSLTAATLPSRASDENDPAFEHARQDTSTNKIIWHRASKERTQFVSNVVD